MVLTVQPGTLTPVVFSNDAGTLLNVVSPSNPMPVTPSGSGSQTVIPVKSTTSTTSQVTVPATTNGIAILAANANRLGAIVTNLGSVPVYWSGAATGLTTANGGVIPAGSSLVIDSPLYTGLIQGIVSTSTQVVDVVEFT